MERKLKTGMELNRKFRMAYVLAAALVAVSALASCGASNTGATQAAGTTTAATEAAATAAATTAATAAAAGSDSSQFPLTDTPLTLNVWGAGSPERDYDTIQVGVELEQKTGIHLNYNLFSNTQSRDEAYNLLIAGGEYPDIITGTLTTNRIRLGIEANMLLPLDDLIEKYGVYYKQALAEHPEYKSLIAANDGNIYSFFVTDSGKHTNSPYKMWIYTEWLDKLGLKAPTTPQEFKDMLVAFKNSDPNGNGEADELGLVGYSSTLNDADSNPICYLMNPFELYTTTYFYFKDNGDAVFVANTDGWRDGLRYMNDLYKSGLLLEETFVQDESQFKSLLNRPAGETIVGAFSRGNQLAIDTKVLNWTDYQAIAPLKGPTGLQQTAARKGVGITLNSAITTACKNPDAAYKLMDWFLSADFNVTAHYGIEGYSYDMSDEPSYLGTTPSYKTRALNSQYMWNYGFFPVYDKAEVRYGATDDPTKRNVDNTYVLLSAAQIYEPFYVWHNTPDIVWCDDQDVITKGSDYMNTITTYTAQAEAAFVLGNQDINSDSDWESYKAGLESLGLQDYLATLKLYYGK